MSLVNSGRDLLDSLRGRLGLWLGVRALAGMGIVGLVLELAVARHWQEWVQSLAWLALALLTLAWALLRASPAWSGRLAALVALFSLVGVWRHVAGNHEAAPLDAVVGPLWDGMSPVAQWWAAASGAVGPAPSLAPGALALLAGMVWLLARVDPQRD